MTANEHGASQHKSLIRFSRQTILGLAVMSGSVLCKLIMTLGTNKLLAEALGPRGFSQFSDTLNLVVIASLFGGGFMSMFVSTHLAQTDSVVDFHQRLLNVCCAVVLCAIGTSVFVFWALPVLIQNFDLQLSVAMIILCSLGNIVVNITIAVLTGTERVRVLAFYSLVQPSLFLALLLIYREGLSIQRTITLYSLSFLVSSLSIFSIVSKLRETTVTFSAILDTLIQSRKHSSMILIGSLIVPLFQIYSRSLITKVSDLQDAGIWQSLAKISELNLIVISSVLGPLFLAKITRVTAKGISSVFGGLFTLLAVYVVFYLSAIFVYGDFIIGTLYSSDFLPAADFFLLQGIGDAFRIFTWGILYTLMIKKMLFEYIAIEVTAFIFLLCLVAVFLNLHGLIGIYFAYSVSNAVVLIFSAGLLYRAIRRGEIFDK